MLIVRFDIEYSFQNQAEIYTEQLAKTNSFSRI